MKLNQIINENEIIEDDLTEAPVGLGSRMLTNIGASLGLSSSQVSKEVNDELIKTYKDLKAFMRGSNIGKNELTSQDMKIFLGKIGYDKDADKIIRSVKKKYNSKPSDTFLAKEIDDIIKSVVAQAFKEKSKFATGKYADSPKKAKGGKGSFKSSRKKDKNPEITTKDVAEFIATMTPEQHAEIKKIIRNIKK